VDTASPIKFREKIGTMLYHPLLVSHSWIRWIVILTGLFAVARGVAGWARGRPWSAADGRAGLWFTLSLDVQVTLGLLLYFAFSPLTATAMEDFGAAMGNSALRFWAVEHGFGAIVALVLAHVGRVRLRKTSDAARRHRLAAIFFGLALVALLASIPWPGTPNARELFRSF
jgi:hypothetical protein